MPKLGSFIAVPLIYESVLTVDALDAALEDFTQVSVANSEIEKQKATYIDEYNSKKESAVDGEFMDEMREFPLEILQPFKTAEEKFVVCLDTLGQDREFSEDERRFILNTVDKFRQAWEAEQIRNLTKQRDDIIVPEDKPQTPGEEAIDVKSGRSVGPDPLQEIETAIEEHLAALAESEGAEIEKLTGIG